MRIQAETRPVLIVLSLLLAVGCASSSQGERPASAKKKAVANPADDEDYAKAIDIFRTSASGKFFDDCYGYAVFPTIGKGGIVVGASAGRGRVYVKNRHVGNTQLAEVSLGWQFGGQAFSQIIFFEDERAFAEFTSGSFEFGATAQAVAITAGASATSTTGGTSAGASGGSRNAVNIGGYDKGYAVFTIAKGGLMVQVAIAGQKFDYAKLGE